MITMSVSCILLHLFEVSNKCDVYNWESNKKEISHNLATNQKITYVYETFKWLYSEYFNKLSNSLLLALNKEVKLFKVVLRT